MSVAAALTTGQYEPLNENTPRVGSAEGAGMNRSALEASRENNRISLSRFSHKAAWVVNRRLVP
jgi:hypothetical protein